jgi:hypothetical protein
VLGGLHWVDCHNSRAALHQRHQRQRNSCVASHCTRNGLGGSQLHAVHGSAEAAVRGSQPQHDVVESVHPVYVRLLVSLAALE